MFFLKRLLHFRPPLVEPRWLISVLRTSLSPEVSLVLLRTIPRIIFDFGRVFRSAPEASYLRPARRAAGDAPRQEPKRSAVTGRSRYAAATILRQRAHVALALRIHGVSGGLMR